LAFVQFARAGEMSSFNNRRTCVSLVYNDPDMDIEHTMFMLMSQGTLPYIVT